MSKKERFENCYNYLKSHGLCHTQKDVAEKMEATEPNVSRAMKGIDTALTDSFLKRFNNAYGNLFNEDWLLTGEGEMLNSPIQQISGVGNVQVGGDAHNVNSGSTIDRMVELFSESQEQVKRRDEHIDRLLSIIERMQDSK